MDNQKRSTQAYKEQLKKMEQQIKELQAFVDEQKKVGSVHWGYVGTVAHYNKTLHEVTDSILSRGEFAD